MRRSVTALATVMILVSGCNPGTPAPTGPTAAQPDRTPQVAVPAHPAADQPSQPPVQPPRPDKPEVRAAGQDLELVGVESASSVVWSPSGHLAVVQAKSGGYLLDAAAPSLTPLPDFAPAEPPAFWSETEVAWMQGGRLQLRDLVSGRDRLIHDFGVPVSHEIRPGDTRYVVSRLNGKEQPGYRFGTIVVGALNGKDETVVIANGHLVDRMSDGQVLAVEGGQPGGPLWSVAPSGQKQLLSKASAHFVQTAPDRQRALWLTGPDTKPASSDQLYEPPLTDLWTWDRTGPPVRIPLGGTFFARAAFSPDGSRIALALNEAIAYTAAADKPGKVAIVENGKLRTLATFPGGVGIGMWLGSDGFRFQPPTEKTGGQAPIMRMDLTGKQEQFTFGLWYNAGIRAQGGSYRNELIMNWGGKGTTVHWVDATRAARVDFNPNAQQGHPLYVPPKAPYLPFAGHDRLWLMRLTY